MIPDSLHYTKTHEWVRREEGTRATVGIAHHAQAELKDIVFVELPTVGKTLTAGQACAVVESVKAAFDIYAPLSGTVVTVNQALVTTPQLINQDCYGQGWFFVLEASQPAEWEKLLPSSAYAALLATTR